MWQHAFAVALVSAAALGYEILLTRVFAITQWHHFAHAIISLALLGFGASGSVLALFRERCRHRFATYFLGATLAFSVSSVACLWLSQRLSANPFMLLWDVREWVHLAAYYLLLSVPFFFGGMAIGLTLMRYDTQISHIYAADLSGAGVGALASIGLLSAVSPTEAVVCLAGVGFIASLVVCFGLPRWTYAGVLLIGTVTVLAGLSGLALNISPYKTLPATLEHPNTRILDSASSPLGWLQLVESPSLHYAPGLSLNYQDPIPPQRGIFVDAEGMSPITRFSGEWPGFLDAMTSSLAFCLLDQPRVLVLGTGGGMDVLAALAHDARHVDAVELNRQVLDWVRSDPEFSGGIYDEQQFPVRLFAGEARGFVEASQERYDLILLTLLDSISAASTGVHASSESYLYTREAFRAYLRHLEPGGILTITRWARNPPRDALRLFATAIQVCPTPATQLAMIRSWRTTTLLVKNGNYTDLELEHIREFCDERSFDLVYLPDMRPDEANRYHQLPEPVYYQACQQLLTSPESLTEQYLFRIEPVTDDRPYFSHFFRWKSFDRLRQRGSNAWFPVEEWGYLLLLATILQALILGLVLILLPLMRLPRQGQERWICLYFLLLGGAFMFVEIVFIQRLVLFLSHPTYAVAVALAGFLLFAGLGSILSSRIERIRWALLGIVGLGALYTLGLTPLFYRLMGLPDVLKILVSLLILAPLAVCMGMPFPLGMRRVTSHTPAMVPWAWGINGCASVVGAVSAVLAAMSFGFTVVTLTALGLYLVAGWAFERL